MENKTSNEVAQLKNIMYVLLTVVFIVSIVFSNFLGASGYSIIPGVAKQNQPVAAVATPIGIIDAAATAEATAVAPDAKAPDLSKVQHWEGKADAPVTVIVLVDPQCPYCKTFHDTIYTPVLKPRIDSGDVRFGIIPFVFLGAESRLVSNAAECVSNNGGDFFAFMDLVYNNQGAENSGVYTVASVVKWAISLGVDEKKMSECVINNTYASQIDTTNAYIQSLGASFTPTVFVDGEMIRDWYDAGTMQIYIENKSGNVDIVPTESTVSETTTTTETAAAPQLVTPIAIGTTPAPSVTPSATKAP